MGSKLTSAFLTLSLFTNLIYPQVTNVKTKEPPSPKSPPVENKQIEKIIDKKAGFIVEENSIKVIRPRFAKKKKTKIVKTKETKFSNFEEPKKIVQKKKNIAKNVKGKRQMYVEATAYSSTTLQCDSSPFITASGTRVRFGTVAANFLPFGTKFKIPNLYGDAVFVVEDRMASWNRIDIWMPTYKEAIQFGRRNVRIVIID